MNAVAEGSEAPAYGQLQCSRCGELLAQDQDWCLRCGDPARTVIAPTPRWRRPLLALGAVALLALGVLAAAFISLTDDDPPPARTITSTITTQPGDALPPGVTPAPAPGATTGPSGPQAVVPQATPPAIDAPATTPPATDVPAIPETEPAIPNTEP